MNTSFDENDGDVQAMKKRERPNGRTGLREREKKKKKHPKTAKRGRKRLILLTLKSSPRVKSSHF